MPKRADVVAGRVRAEAKKQAEALVPLIEAKTEEIMQFVEKNACPEERFFLFQIDENMRFQIGRALRAEGFTVHASRDGLEVGIRL